MLEQGAAVATATLADRRRPGRLTAVSPALLSLLRAEERGRLPALVEAGDDFTASDRILDAGGGVALGVALGSLLWIAIIAAGRALLGF